MRTLSRCLIGCWAVLLVASSGAQQSPPQSPPATPPTQPSPSPPATPPAREPSDADDIFIPTEEVQADEELAFPVDI